jgi:hypothetical protein
MSWPTPTCAAIRTSGPAPGGQQHDQRTLPIPIRGLATLTRCFNLARTLALSTTGTARGPGITDSLENYIVVIPTGFVIITTVPDPGAAH